jgi:hypothetical protein
MKMNKRIQKVAVVSALTLAFAVPAFANPFSDVPAKHWAYDSVNKLAAAGVIDGYGDGTFKGDKTMTRYEMAQIVGKAMNKSLNADQQAAVDKLAREFAVELNTMGVKVDGMQTQIDNMPIITGDARARFSDAGDGVNGGIYDKTSRNYELRGRVGVDGKINDNLRYNTRLSGTFDNSSNNNEVGIQLDTANVTLKSGALNSTIGRQDVILGSGVMFDDTLNGLGLQAGGLKLYAGKTTGGVDITRAFSPTGTTEAERMYGAEYGIGTNGHVKLAADYLKIGDNKAYGVNGSIPLGKAVTANAEYIKNDTNKASATAFGVKFNKIGLSATHRDADAGVYNAYSTSDLIALPTDVEIKGMEYQYDRNLAKNVDMQVKYQDFDNMDTRTSAAVNIKF